MTRFTISDDHLVILIGFLVNWFFLALFIIKSRKRQKGLLINLIIQAIYSACFFYGLANSGGFPDSLTYFLGLLASLALHVFVCLILFLRLLIVNRKPGTS